MLLLFCCSTAPYSSWLLHPFAAPPRLFEHLLTLWNNKRYCRFIFLWPNPRISHFSKEHSEEEREIPVSRYHRSQTRSVQSQKMCVRNTHTPRCTSMFDPTLLSLLSSTRSHQYLHEQLMPVSSLAKKTSHVSTALPPPHSLHHEPGMSSSLLWTSRLSPSQSPFQPRH